MCRTAHMGGDISGRIYKWLDIERGEDIRGGVLNISNLNERILEYRNRWKTHIAGEQNSQTMAKWLVKDLIHVGRGRIDIYIFRCNIRRKRSDPRQNAESYEFLWKKEDLFNDYLAWRKSVYWKHVNHRLCLRCYLLVFLNAFLHNTMCRLFYVCCIYNVSQTFLKHTQVHVWNNSRSEELLFWNVVHNFFWVVCLLNWFFKRLKLICASRYARLCTMTLITT